MRRPIAVVTGVVTIVVCPMALVRGADAPAAGESGVTIGEMRVQTFPSKTYAYVAVETSFEKMGGPVRAAFDAVFKAAGEGKLRVACPTMLIYQGRPHAEPGKDFKVEIGAIVPHDTAAPSGGGEVKVRKVEAFRCATVLYTGPVNRQGDAYQKLIPALRTAGHMPPGRSGRCVCILKGSSRRTTCS